MTATTLNYASRLNDDGSIEAMWREHRIEGIANCSKFWSKATRLKKFAGRDQWPDKDKDKLKKSPRVTVPETARILATFSGRQMMQRFERAYVARHQSAEKFAEVMTKVDHAVMQATDAEQVDSQVFKDGPGIQGISWARYYIDEMSGPEPQLRKEKVPIWSMMWPSTCDINLRDRAWHRWGSWWPQAAVKERWSSQFEKIKTQIGSKSWTVEAQKHGESSRIPWAGQAGNKPLEQADYYDPKSRNFWIEYEEWREAVTFYSVAKPRDPAKSYSEALGETVMAGQEDNFERVEMTGDEWREFKKNYEAIHGEEVPKEMMVRKPRLVYRYGYGCGDTVLEWGDLEVGIFTFTAMAAEVVEHQNETQYIGLMEDLVDAQLMKNYMRSALLRDLAINPKGTLFVEQGLFRDKDAALTAFTSPGGVVEVPRGKLSQGSQPFQFVAGGTGQYRSMVENMHQTYHDDISRLAGFNPAALGQLGSDLRRISGQVVRSVQDAAMVSNAERFDALRLDRREGGRIFLAFMRLMYKKPEDLIPFIGEEDAYEEVTDPTTGEPIPDEMGQPQRRLAIPPVEMWVPSAWKEIAVEEVTPTDDDQQAFWDSLQTQIQLLTQPMADIGEGILGSEDIVDLMPKVPAARRQKMLLRVKRLMARKQQADMMAQQQAQMQQQQPPAEEAAVAA